MYGQGQGKFYSIQDLEEDNKALEAKVNKDLEDKDLEDKDKVLEVNKGWVKVKALEVNKVLEVINNKEWV